MQDKARFSASLLCHSRDADLVLTTQQTLTAIFKSERERERERRRRRRERSSQEFITVFPYILWHLLACKKAPCVETTTVCPSATHNRWLHRPSIFMKCCRVYVLQMSRMCGFGANQLSESYFIKGIKEFPPVLSIFVVICGCDSLQEKHKRSQSQRRTVYFV